jgi:hypothetical protein
MNGHFNFHYDENINRQSASAMYKITKWQEI